MSLLGLAGSPPADLFISIPIFERGVAFDEWDIETFEAFPRIEGSEWEEYEFGMARLSRILQKEDDSIAALQQSMKLGKTLGPSPLLH